MRQFRDRVAALAGAASGIGRPLSAQFAAEGMRVVLAEQQLRWMRGNLPLVPGPGGARTAELPRGYTPTPQAPHTHEDPP
jgi:NAD(P)-dependent dehydrogenase (short-subunit alcohol dehydrogenase family)